MKNDYGYFGKGFEGYMHYLQAIKETQNNSGNHGKSRGKGTAFYVIILIYVLMDFIAKLLDY